VAVGEKLAHVQRVFIFDAQGGCLFLKKEAVVALLGSIGYHF
jgi:hypothetical protein